jgi:hypothetical protein
MLPQGVDVSLLRIGEPADRPLVTSGGQPFITVSEYNAWLGTYPLAITESDPEVARKQAIEQMVRFKLIAGRARDSGYEGRLHSAGDDASERSMVLMYIRDQMSNISLVSDGEAQDFRRSHPDRIAAIEADDLPEEVRLAATKSAILGERFRERVETWMDEAELTYGSDLPAGPVAGGPR